MSIRTILAPGVEWKETDKSQYSPAMVGTNCFVMGFSDRGEPYTPMEFTSRTAWSTYYGTPDNEAERYAYAAACEVLDHNGRLFFSRLPYDNPAFEKAVCFKYSVKKNKTISCMTVDGGNSPFHEIKEQDHTICDAAAIEPAMAPCLYDLSAVDEYRTGENMVANNTFMIADISFNTYGKVPEDDRKNDRREMIGIMPVVTTAANAMHAQNLIDVAREDVIGFETIGAVRTLDASMQLSDVYPSLSCLSSNTIREADMARLVNTKNYYKYVETVSARVTAEVLVDSLTAETDISGRILEAITADEGSDAGSWDGSWQIDKRGDDPDVSSYAQFSYKKSFTSAMLTSDGRFEPGEVSALMDKFGWHNPGGDDSVPDTVSQEANSYFPTIGTVVNEAGEVVFDRDHLKKIGVVVYKMFLDPSEGNKISFEPVEAYAGSLRKTDRDPNTGATQFIDTIINSQSRYINFFSNCFNAAADRKYYDETLDILVVRPGPKRVTVEFDISKVGDFPPAIQDIANALGISLATVDVNSIRLNTQELERLIEGIESDAKASKCECDTLGGCRTVLEMLKEKLDGIPLDDTTCPSMGFYSAMTEEDISISKSIYDGMNKALEKVSDLNRLDIDIIPDAGLANIASYLKALYGDRGKYDLLVTDDVGNSLLGMWRCDSNNAAVKTWKTVEQKLDNFCKNTRKDCMFIADGPRPLVLQGQKKIIRPSKPANTIDEHIVPYLKYAMGLNTSYGACYVDWFEQADDYSGDFFWCPPSIKAMGVYINTDVNFNYWDAPAGLNRGVIAATDVAFSPTVKQAGCFYEKNFNYAVDYPDEGIVLEGQKTLQTKPSAFDRVNVRRLFLRLERACYKVARWFVYEGNTAYTRQRLVDALDPYFKDAKFGGGVYDYKIICDETINTSDTIDRNELHVKIGIKPVKTIEFIMIDFVCLRTGGSWSEAGF